MRQIEATLCPYQATIYLHKQEDAIISKIDALLFGASVANVIRGVGDGSKKKLAARYISVASRIHTILTHPSSFSHGTPRRLRIMR